MPGAPISSMGRWRTAGIRYAPNLKKIDVEPDFGVWKEYAYKQGIHGAILSYLEIRKDHFYAMETTVDGKRFVTAPSRISSTR